MTTHAYDETYVNDAMNTLGEMLDCAINECGEEPEDFFAAFARSGIAHCFEHGNPKYVAGLSGTELAQIIINRPTGVQTLNIDKSPEYWAGWAIAYYQWYTDMSFADLGNRGLTISKMFELYPTLHEADLSKLISVADRIAKSSSLTTA